MANERIEIRIPIAKGIKNFKSTFFNCVLNVFKSSFNNEISNSNLMWLMAWISL